MSITVEFFGILRARTGLGSIELEAGNLGEVFEELERRFPELAENCFQQGRLCSGYLANRNGNEFVVEPDTPLMRGDSVLILSADVGG